MSIFRRTTDRIEHGSHVLATASGVKDCIETIRESLIEIIPAELRNDVLSRLGFSATGVGLISGSTPYVPLAVLGVLAAFQVQSAKQRHTEKVDDFRARDRALANLDISHDLLQSIKRDIGRQPTAEQVTEIVKNAVQKSVQKQIKEALTELGIGEEELNHFKTQLTLFAAEIAGLNRKIDLISDDVSHRPWLELPRPAANPDLFLHHDMVIPLVGRTSEWERLNRFLDTKSPFSWWRIIDAGGAGKSRIATELCWSKLLDGWTVGFLQPTDPETWSRWRVTGDTLIVIDYVFARWDAAALGKIMDTLAQYSGPHRIRLLVLERSDTGPWWNWFRRTDGEKSGHDHGFFDEVLDSRSYESRADRTNFGKPLTLPPLGDDATRSLLAFVLQDAGCSLDSDGIELQLRQFRELDPKGRPLFAAFYADAISRDPDRLRWNRIEIARSVFTQKLLKSHLSGKSCQPIEIDSKHLNLLVLATLIGGVARYERSQKHSDGIRDETFEGISMQDVICDSNLAKLLPTKWDPESLQWEHDWHDEQVAILASYSDEFDELDPYLPELQPDPLGEALVLERLAGRALAKGESAAAASRASEALLIAAGDLAPRYFSAWVERALQDFPTECSSDGLALRSYQTDARWGEIPNDISHWTRLKTLSLSGPAISDISPLKALTELTFLQISHTGVTDLSALAKLTKIRTLVLSSNLIEDISILKELIKIQDLTMHLDRVSNISPIGSLVELRTLWLTGTNISDISLIGSLVELRTLRLNYTDISDIAPLRNLTELRELILVFAPVQDLSPISELHKLTDLDLTLTKVVDISPFRNLVQLKHLNLCQTRVRDVSPLKDLNALRELNLALTPVTDVSALEKLPELVEVSLPDGISWNPQYGPPHEWFPKK